MVLIPETVFGYRIFQRGDEGKMRLIGLGPHKKRERHQSACKQGKKPCEDTVRRLQSARQGEGPLEKSTMLTP